MPKFFVHPPLQANPYLLAYNTVLAAGWAYVLYLTFATVAAGGWTKEVLQVRARGRVLPRRPAGAARFRCVWVHGTLCVLLWEKLEGGRQSGCTSVNNNNAHLPPPQLFRRLTFR